MTQTTQVSEEAARTLGTFSLQEGCAYSFRGYLHRLDRSPGLEITFNKGKKRNQHKFIITCHYNNNILVISRPNIQTYPKNLHFLQRELLHADRVLRQNNDFLHGTSIWKGETFNLTPPLCYQNDPQVGHVSSAVSPVPRNSTS